MLSLFYKNKIITKNKLTKYVNQNPQIYNDNSSSIREWTNSLYVYNKKILNSIPESYTLSTKLIASYFNLYNIEVEKLLRTKILSRRLRRFSSNKIYFAKSEFKHTNNKITITLFIYNRQILNYISIAEKSYIKSFMKESFSKRLLLIKRRALHILDNSNVLANNLFFRLKINPKERRKLYRSIYNFYKRYTTIVFTKLELYLYYKQLVLINKFKTNYVYLIQLRKYLEKIYNKNVEFNLINIRRFYLNSDILSESVSLKITRNRRKLLRLFNKVKKKIKTHKNNIYLINSSDVFRTTKLYTKNYIYSKKLVEKSLVNKLVLESIRYKHINGFRLETKGRLTRRYTASRSISKFKYKGSLLNINSSYRGLRSLILRGNLSSNLQYTNISYTTRIGSFGIKGWISSN